VFRPSGVAWPGPLVACGERVFHSHQETFRDHNHIIGCGAQSVTSASDLIGSRSISEAPAFRSTMGDL
jgi:hypothetical protein